MLQCFGEVYFRMEKKIYNRTFLKFVFIGIINTLVGSGIMFLFYNVFHFTYWVSSASNYFLASILSYFLNRGFTFRNHTSVANTLPKFIINIVMCYLIAYGVAKPIISAVLTSYTQIVQENIAMLLGMCIFTVLNYLGQRHFVFRER